MYAICDKLVIWLNICEMSPESSHKTAKNPKFERKQMDYGEILQIAKTSSTFGAKWARKLWNFTISPSDRVIRCI